jgi:hypothetical protein
MIPHTHGHRKPCGTDDYVFFFCVKVCKVGCPDYFCGCSKEVKDSEGLRYYESSFLYCCY